ncbi:zinc finger protein 148-like isoform X2 [Callorhinchus milii]|uniref:zinc finger protein 148-like isoform X2 n=1 Tax=Callorhinchus milii TaxID=7868 RepID=UPI001C3FD2BA|nr:zinc finger protein 148-like isoform X2 [Callorhinchus milii]
MSRVDGISDHSSVPLGGQGPLLERRGAARQEALVDNAILRDNSRQSGLSVNQTIVGSHGPLQSQALGRQGMLTDGNLMLPGDTIRRVEGDGNNGAVTMAQGVTCVSQVLGKGRGPEGMSQLDEKKRREQEDLLKLRENETLLKLREHQDLVKMREHEDFMKLREHEEFMKLREHEDFMKKQKNKKIRTTSKILVVGEDGSFMVKSPKTHICEQCSAAFRTNYHLQRHILIHTGEKPFHCDECDMRFIQKYHMERHKRTHSGEKPYQCEYCLQHFSRTDRLLKHRRMCHENQGKTPGKSPAVKTEPIILTINADDRFLALQKEGGNPRKKLKAAEKSTLPGSNKEESLGRGENKGDKGDCMDYYTSNLKVKDEYKVEQCSLVIAHASHSTDALGEAYHNNASLNPPKLILKKVNAKKSHKAGEQLAPNMSVTGSYDPAKVNKYGYGMVDNPELLGIEEAQSADPSRKPGSSSNYDDAMQFVKKKRFLQGVTSASRDFPLSEGQIASQPAVSQPPVPPAPDNSSAASMMVQGPGGAELKGGQDKSGIPDEVLQTLLDHYTNKANGQVPFSVNDSQVASNITVSSSDIPEVPPAERVSEGGQPPAPDNCNMLHEYSKFLQQALERTCHNDNYSAEQGLAYEAENQALGGSLQVQPLFSTLERQVFATMVTQHGFRPDLTSSLRLPTQKSPYSLLVGEAQQPSFAFIPTVTGGGNVPAPQDFIEQVASQKKREDPPSHRDHQMGAFGQAARLHFAGSAGEMAPAFGSGAGGQVNLRVRPGGADFAEFSLVNEGRDGMSSSPDTAGGQAFR